MVDFLANHRWLLEGISPFLIILVGEYPNEIPMRKTSCRKVSHDIPIKNRYYVGLLDETIIVDQHKIPGFFIVNIQRHSSHLMGNMSWNNDTLW